MNPKSQLPKPQDVALSSLNVAIDAMNLMKDVMEGTPAKAAFASVSIILTMIRVGLLSSALINHKLTYTGFDAQQNRPR